MYFEQALSLMREGHIISRGIPGDDVSSDRWELADDEENIQ